MFVKAILSKNWWDFFFSIKTSFSFFLRNSIQTRENFSVSNHNQYVSIKMWLGILFLKINRCLKRPALSNKWRQKTQGQLSPPTICLAAKKWTTQKTTKAWIVEGAGDGFEFLLALLVQNGIPCTYANYLVIFSENNFSYLTTVQLFFLHKTKKKSSIHFEEQKHFLTWNVFSYRSIKARSLLFWRLIKQRRKFIRFLLEV